MKTIYKSKIVISRISAGDVVSVIRKELSTDDSSWFRISAKAYSLYLEEARKKRSEMVKSKNVLTTSNEEINEILQLNEALSAYALCIPIIATRSDIDKSLKLLQLMPQAESKLLLLIEHMTLEPRIRALQNVGRIRKFSVFIEFACYVEAATLCYYRGNYSSSYLTLVPVIEGIILRWSGYDGIGEKPEFEAIRKFFSGSHVRQPCPCNPLFHEVFCKACDKILSEHLYQPSHRGTAYAQFNRHQAAHLLRDTSFATRENCIRLFLLLDTMTEIYLYETDCQDYRRALSDEDIQREFTMYQSLISEKAKGHTPESILL